MSGLRLLGSVLVVLTAAAAGFGCDPGHAVEVTNGTSLTITPLFDGEPTVPSIQLAPGESTTVATINEQWPSTIGAQDASGRVIFSHLYTQDEIKAANWKVLVTCGSAVTDSPEPSPTTTPAC